MVRADERGRRELPDPYVFAGVVAVIVSAIAVQRQASREALELGDPPSSGVVDDEGPSAPSPEPAASPRGTEAPRAAPAMPAAPAPLGTALEAAAMETFTDARPGLLECLRAERAVRPGISGKLSVAVRVVDQGLVANVDLGPSPVRSPDFDECATLTLAQLVFPAGVAPRDLTITYDLR